jgi:hypothetical protein
MQDAPAIARPLSVGEIFDRALTVYIRQWRQFTLLAVILVLPDAWFSYYKESLAAATSGVTGSPTLPNMLAVFMAHAKSESDAILWGTIAVSSLVAVALYPAFLRGLLAGRDIPSLARLVAPGFARFGRLLGVVALWAAVFAIVLVSIFIVLVPIILIAATSRNVPVIVGISIGFGVAFGLLAAFLMGIPFSWSLFIAVDEDQHAFTAVRSAIARALNRRRFWRTLGIGTSLFALNIVLGFALRAIVAIVFLWTKSALLFALLNSLVSLPLLAFGALVNATYFLDARLRDSGTNVQVPA